MSQHNHLYNNARWRARRQQQLQQKPLCAMCAAEGRVTVATVADHTQRHDGNPIKFWSIPLQSLCATCHSKWKQIKELNGFYNSIDENGFPKDLDHPFNK